MARWAHLPPDSWQWKLGSSPLLHILLTFSTLLASTWSRNFLRFVRELMFFSCFSSKFNILYMTIPRYNSYPLKCFKNFAKTTLSVFPLVNQNETLHKRTIHFINCQPVMIQLIKTLIVKILFFSRPILVTLSLQQIERKLIAPRVMYFVMKHQNLC